MTSAEKAARLAMLNGLLAAFNVQRDTTNAANAALNAAITAGDSALDSIVRSETGVVLALNDFKPLLLAQIAATEAVTPSDPLPPPPDPVPVAAATAVFTRNLAMQDPTGGSTTPDWESAHKLNDGRIASIGWVGGHVSDLSNAIYAFNPISKQIDTLSPWRKQSNGLNAYCTTCDNAQTAYFASTDTLVHFGHCVFDVGAKSFLRGDRPPSTRLWNTYATGFDPAMTVMNPVYAACPALDCVAFYGSSYGGYGISPTGLQIWKHTGPPDAPWQATVVDLGNKGIMAMVNARNNAICVGTKMYLGGGRGIGATLKNSEFTSKAHGYKRDYEVAFFSDIGQAGVPPKIISAQIYYVIPTGPDTFRIASAAGGPAIETGDDPVGAGFTLPNYRMWTIDLATLEVELVSTEWNCGKMNGYPQMLLDDKRNRLLLLSGVVTAYDLGAKKWGLVDVSGGWPAGGFRSVVGAISGDSVYFRGTPLVGPTYPGCWQWNSLDFGSPAAKPASSKTKIGPLTSYGYADGNVAITWDKSGGDSIDANGARNSATPKPFASASVDPNGGVQKLTFDVKTLVQELLKENNGILLKYVSGWGWAHGAQKENPNYPGPKLTVNGGVRELLLDTWLAPSGGGGLVDYPRFEDSTIIMHDLTGITDVASAILEITSFENYGPVTMALFKLDPPVIIDDPALLGPEEPGVATAADIVFKKKITANLQDMLAAGFGPQDQVGNICGVTDYAKTNPDHFEVLPNGCLRVKLEKGSNYGSSFRTYDPKPNTRELYIQHGITIPGDAGDVEGVKLPGPQGSGFSLRTEHGAHSPQNPMNLSSFTYAYAIGNNTIGSGSGEVWFSAQDRHFALRKGATIYPEQHINLNTFNADGSPRPDGLYELWMNWRKVYQWKGVLNADPNAGITEWLMWQIYHGGVAFATHAAFYTLWPIMIARKFIGRQLYMDFLAAA